MRDLRRSGRVAGDAPNLLDFDGLDSSDKVDFCAHEASWSNRMILRDSLLAMVEPAERKGLRGKVQIIYLNPPRGRRCGPAIPTAVNS